MKYIINHSNDTAFNIALEEYAFKHLLDEDQIFLLWINKPSIIVGRHQNTIEEINRDYVRENGIEVVRRISGGGAVYHDLNNLNSCTTVACSLTLICQSSQMPLRFQKINLNQKV